MLSRILCISIILFVAAPALGQHTDSVANLIARLGSAKYGERETAMRQLEARGAAALAELRQAKLSADPEVSVRAGTLVRAVEERLEAERLLAGKRVRLTFDNTRVVDAVNEIARQTGFAITIEGDLLGVRDRKITLDTGATTFWDAFEQFCAKAGVRERPSPVAKSPPYIDSDARAVLIDVSYSGPRPTPPNENKTIRLIDAQPEKSPTFVSGGLRVRALAWDGLGNPSYGGASPSRRVGFQLEVRPEPNHAWQGVVGMRIDKAIDEHGQVLTQPEPFRLPEAEPLMQMDGWRGAVVMWDASTGAPMIARGFSRLIPALLAPGAKDAKRLKEVHGTLTAEAQTLRPIVTVDDILKAAGRTVKGEGDGSFKVIEVVRTGQQLRVRVQIDGPSNLAVVRQMRAQRVRQGFVEFRGDLGGNDPNLALVDAKNQTLSPARLDRTNVLGADNRGQPRLTLECQATFHLPADGPAPQRLVYSARKMVLVTMPFTLRDVPLTTSVAGKPSR
jgi:hypothetical protein